jgi:hypothetical protein
VRGRITRIALLLLSALLLLGLLGCAPAVKKTERLSPEEVLPLRRANLEELLEQLRQQEAAITSINAVAELIPSTGSAYSGVIEQYHDVRVFVLAERRPPNAAGNPTSNAGGRWVRLLGQAPIVRKNIFDMVANEESFRIFLPTKNKFVVGPTRLSRHSDKPIENLRPQHLFDALFFQAPRSEALHLLEENEFAGLRYYAVSEITAPDSGRMELQRKWWFERSRLDLVRVQHFEAGGKLVADIHYADWRRDGPAPFPGRMELVRPQEDYRLKLTIKELTLNQPLLPDTFELEKPAGVEVVELKDELPLEEPQ